MQADNIFHRLRDKTVGEILAQGLLVDKRQTADVVQSLDRFNHRFGKNLGIIRRFGCQFQCFFQIRQLHGFQICAADQLYVALPEFCFHNFTLF